MAQQLIEHHAITPAAPEVVYALLIDGSTWPQWSPLGSFELVEAGDGSPEGVGAIRIFRTRRGLVQTTSRERVVTARENEEFGYELVSGMPLRDYRAVITLGRLGDGGTAIGWHSTFEPKVPGTGWLYRRLLGGFIGQVVEGLAAHATASVSR